VARREFKHASIINVHMWGHLVGRMARDPNSGFYAFRYDEAFRRLGIEPSPLHMPTGVERSFIFPNLSESTFRRLPALISDSLPDRFGNALIERSLADYGILKSEITPLDRLAYIGSRAMGALTFQPALRERKSATAIELKELVEEARRAVGGELDDSNGLQHIIAVGISAGGARPKAVVCWNPTTEKFIPGQFDAPKGYEHWLLKFDGIENGPMEEARNEGCIEYAYYLMAQSAGIRMSECRLHREGGRAHFMTKRFDRGPQGIRHHVQTLCAMDHMDLAQMGAYSYTQLFDVIQKLGLPEESLQEAFRRMVFNVAACNMDDHTKNTSFLLKEEGNWELAPAYDLTFAYSPNGKWNYQHFLSVNGKSGEITRKDLLADAERYSIQGAKGILDEVCAAIAQWDNWAIQARIPLSQAKEIANKIGKI